MHTIEAYYGQQVPWESKRLVGQIKWPADNGHSIATALKDRCLVGVSDGSVKGALGIHAWMLMARDRTAALKGKGLVNGACAYM